MSILEKFRKRLFVGTVPPKKKKNEKKCKFLKSLGRGYLSEQSQQKKGDKVSILEKFRDYWSEQSHKKKEKKCKFLKSLGRGYLSEQSQQKKGEKVSILEKFRDYLSEQSHKKKGEKL